MSQRFEDIIKNGQLLGPSERNRTKGAAQAISWYRTLAAGSTTDTSIKGRTVSKVTPGEMVMFVYDAKTKDTLPFWDAFPLIFPVDDAKGGFYGINLHYLPVRLRALLMDRLMDHATDKRFDEKTKLIANYQLLKNTASLKAFQPCFKRYLQDHTRSKFIKIFPPEWKLALQLPLESFQKQSSQHVWDDSVAQINKKQ